jgi:predicted transcriptional regulator
MRSLREHYHPNAYLQRIKNVKSGLEARTRLLSVLEKQPAKTRKLGFSTALSYSTVTYHLRHLEKEAAVVRKGKKPCVWHLTGLGQKRLLNLEPPFDP